MLFGFVHHAFECLCHHPPISSHTPPLGKVCFGLPVLLAHHGLELADELLHLVARPHHGGESASPFAPGCSTDIHVFALLDELRIVPLLIENNRTKPQHILIEVEPWKPCKGEKMPDDAIKVTPADITLDPGKATLVNISVDLTTAITGFEECRSYYARLQLTDSVCKHVSIRVDVLSRYNCNSYFPCDPCRPRNYQAAPYCHMPSASSGHGHHDYHGSCCCDPHNHW